MRRIADIKNKISAAFEQYFRSSTASSRGLVSSISTWGKVYEAYILSIIARDLTRKEGCDLRLSRGTTPVLKTSPGPINPSYPSIKVMRGGIVIGEIWTDIEFLTLSYTRNRRNLIPGPGDFHELDIVMTQPGVQDRPIPDQILLGVECKHTPYQKTFLREILGIRRELSFWVNQNKTDFIVWPRHEIPANPPSCLLAYSSSALINNFTTPGEMFGIDFVHEPV